MERRGFLKGLLASPFIVRTPGLLMPIKQVLILPEVGVDFAQDYGLINKITKEAIMHWTYSNAFMERIDEQYAKAFGVEGEAGTSLRVSLPRDYRVDKGLENQF